MKPEPRDRELVARVVTALHEHPGAVVQLRCGPKAEADMLRQLVPEELRSRVLFTWMVFDAAGQDRAVIWEGKLGP